MLPTPEALCPSLVMATWARHEGLTPTDTQLLVELQARPTPMAHSPATGQALVSNGHLGVDVIRLAGGTGFVPHTHPGDHLLIVIGGYGTVTYDGKIYPTEAGQVYLVPGAIPHAVGAITDHVILAVGAPHSPVDSPERMRPVAYEAILAATDRLHCLLCDVQAVYPLLLHMQDCPHCPCQTCLGKVAHSKGSMRWPAVKLPKRPYACSSAGNTY